MAIVFGLAAFGVVHAYASRIEARSPGRPVSVVVAAGEEKRGTVLVSSMLRVQSVPSAFAPPGAVHSPGAAAGRTLLTDVGSGEPITWTRVGEAGAGPLAAMVPRGLLAVVVHSSLPPGTIAEGDRVDVIATFTGGTGSPHTELVGSGLQVLTVLGSAKQSVALLVDEAESQQIAYALSFADVTLAVDGPGRSSADFVSEASPSPGIATAGG